LDQQRLQGMPVSVAIYTNLSRDHLDYHADMAEYAAAKAKLFDKAHFPELTHAIINIDDEHAQIMLDTAQASQLTVWTYSLDPAKSATFVAAEIKPSLQGVEIALRTDFGNSEFDNADFKNSEDRLLKTTVLINGALNTISSSLVEDYYTELNVDMRTLESILKKDGLVDELQNQEG